MGNNKKKTGKTPETTTIHSTKPNVDKCTGKKEIANLLATEFQRKSSIDHYPHKFQKYKKHYRKKTYIHLHKKEYNILFIITQLKNLHKQK